MYEKYKQKVEELEKATISPQADHIPLWVQELPYKEFPASLMELWGTCHESKSRSSSLTGSLDLRHGMRIFLIHTTT